MILIIYLSHEKVIKNKKYNEAFIFTLLLSNVNRDDRDDVCFILYFFAKSALPCENLMSNKICIKTT